MLKIIIVIAIILVLFLDAMHAVQRESPLITSCVMEGPCSCRTNYGKLINLKELGRVTARGSTNGDKQDFRWEPCSTFNIGGLTGVTAVQHVQSTGAYYDIGTDPYIDFVVNRKGVVQIMMVSQERERMSYIDLTCSRDKTKWIFKREQPKKTYYFELRSPFSCPGYRPPKSSALSTGSILTITFFVLVMVYIVCGVLFLAKKREAKGLDMIPNKDMWIQLPALIRDGCQFVATCGTCRRGEYAKI